MARRDWLACTAERPARAKAIRSYVVAAIDKFHDNRGFP
jgi:hypothetical protein